MSIKTGVFVCDCGTNIAGTVNVPEVAEYARKLDSVVFVNEGKWICSVDYLSKIKQFITEHKLDRVVVACCTPRTHEPTFKSALKEAGLNPHLLEFVSIREQCSWVHKADIAVATQKAKDLVRMGVSKSILLEPAEGIRIPVGKECLIIGGGIAGMTASLAVAEQGFKVILVEKSANLGGILGKLDMVAPANVPAEKIIAAKMEQIERHPNIRCCTDTVVEQIRGYIGNYNVKLTQKGAAEDIKVSTIIVATGMREIEPSGLFGYGKYPGIITQLQLEERLKNKQLGPVKTVAMINCVNSKNDERGCCSVGCLISVKNAMAIKELDKDVRVYIINRDLSLLCAEPDYLKSAVAQYDIKLLRYSEDKPPDVFKSEQGGKVVKTYDILLGRDIEIAADLIVLTAAFQGDETAGRMKELLKVSANRDNFFQEAHIKLRPLDFSTDGIYLCGCARSPKRLKDTVEEALGAALRAGIPMKRGYIESEGIVADINLEICSECGLCHKNCPFGAIELAGKQPFVIKAICKGCGICAANCPKEAINIIHFTNEQILAQVEAALSERPQEQIIAFCCHWCAMGAVDIAGVSRLQYPANIRIIRVMCAGRISESFVNKAFQLGAAGVLVAGCEFPTCHYITGNYKCKEKMERLKKKLAGKNIEDKRLRTAWLSAADGPKFAKTVREMVKDLGL
ncbi:MAG: hydrogenase iron-sulfur subunit [Planctomycetes bacterium]|nr:hydrogenase iron-sulfur subunit [Planctomycetota bacterium]